jgi:hypothetical protein
VFTLGDTEDDTDVAALRDKYITVTPLQFDLTHYPMLREWQDKEWRIDAREATAAAKPSTRKQDGPWQ